MRTFGLIGYPLSHSFSQGYFSEKFKNEGIEARYLNFPIASINDFKGLLDQHPYLAGLNVTIPYKEQVVPFLDELDDEAARIGAVNVIKIVWKNKKPLLKGYNSDVDGFINSLKPLLQPWHGKALILGTGGASKAVAHGLLKAGILYRYVSRTPKTSAHVSYNALTPEIISEYNLIINTSPVGMYPLIAECPPLPYDAISRQHLIFDLIYNPDRTLLMKKAAQNGAVVKNGLEMLHLQAEKAWEIWNK
jgi:shikimate dehydrogenase